jgi:CheY-like chemotaxis protein
MKTEDLVILIAEDDPGHTRLIEKNLARAGVRAPIRRFADGQQILDFLFRRGDGDTRKPNVAYVLLLDIRMPKVEGIEVLRQIKEDPHLRRIPVIVFTTTEDPRDVARCHALGCNSYIVKPVDYGKFATVIRQLGEYINFARFPAIPA